MRTRSRLRQIKHSAACIFDPSWPGFFWITSLLYNTDARLEGRKRARRVRMDIHGSEPAQYTWISVIERGVYRKKPQPRTWEFYMKLGNILLHSKLLHVGIYSLRYLDQFLSQRRLAIGVNTHVSRCRTGQPAQLLVARGHI